MNQLISRRAVVSTVGMGAGLLLLRPGALFSATAGTAIAAEPQPYFAGVHRALEALAKLGAPVAVEDAQQIAALAQQNDSAAVSAAEKILARYTLVDLLVDSNGPGSVGPGGAQPSLIEQGWQLFLIRVSNPKGLAEPINFGGENDILATGPGHMQPGESYGAQRAWLMDTINKAPLIKQMWLMSQVYETTPIARSGYEIQTFLPSGLPVEYRIIQVFSRDSGRRAAKLYLNVFPRSGDWSYDPAYREIQFDCLPSRTVALAIHDADGRGCVASLTIKDKRDHLYPPQAMRLAPDMFFQPQVYRADGETMRLPDGEYTVEARRGPEYLRTVQNITIDAGRNGIDVKLERWIDPAKWGWYSGDTHIHAAGCAHYTNPTEGVSPETIIRHVRGEGLAIAEVLTWGGGRYYQKQFFTGHAESPAATLEHPYLQVANNATLQPHPTPTDNESLLRYDAEIAGFPSSLSGHLILLRLKEQDYPGTTGVEEWPSWTLPILKWAKAQGAVVGFAHCGWGMSVESNDLPNYDIPPFDSIGTNEAIIDVTHGLVDFLSCGEGKPAAELNAWYHMLNSGFRLAMLGETDWPCATDECPGLGRTYVRLDHRPLDDHGYEAWILGLNQGQLYYGDGRSHFLDFKVGGRRSGEGDLALHASSEVAVEALVAARLEPQSTPETEALRKQPYTWHLEKARISATREVPVELVVNGLAVAKTTVLADGAPRSIKFKATIARSSWVALRILPSGHTHPVFVQVGSQPIRASKRSAQWCRTCVDKVWEVKSPFMRDSERAAAAEAFDHARQVYDRIIGECEIA